MCTVVKLWFHELYVFQIGLNHFTVVTMCTTYKAVILVATYHWSVPSGGPMCCESGSKVCICQYWWFTCHFFFKKAAGNGFLRLATPVTVTAAFHRLTYLTNAPVSVHCTKVKWIIAILLTRLVYPANILTRLQLSDVWLVSFTAFPRLLCLACWCETFNACLLSGWQVSATRGRTPACLDLISKQTFAVVLACGENSGKRTGPMFVLVHFSPQYGKYSQATDVCKISQLLERG